MVKKLWQSVLSKRHPKGRHTSIGQSMTDSTQQALKTSSIYQCCNELPYEIFKLCSVDRTYGLLVHNKTHLSLFNEDELETHYWKLYSEFSIISGDENSAVISDEYRELIILESKILRVKVFAHMLTISYNKFAISKLAEIGFSYQFTADTYQEDLKSITRRLRSDEAMAIQLGEGIKGKMQGTSTAVTYAMFDEKITMIERALKIPIDVTKLSTQMYGVKLKALMQIIDSTKTEEEED